MVEEIEMVELGRSGSEEIVVVETTEDVVNSETNLASCRNDLTQVKYPPPPQPSPPPPTPRRSKRKQKSKKSKN